jgi:hypothetical protein
MWHSQVDFAMNRSVCPYLGTLDSQERPGPAVEYPSLENQCFAVPANELLLLGDQASFCLVSGHRHCPRFQAAQRTPPGVDAAHADDEPSITFDEAATTEGASAAGVLVGNLATVFGAQHAQLGRRWAWAGALLVFVTVFLCGGSMAAYTGWQLVRARYLEATPGQLDTLNSQPAPAEPLYLVVTATSPPAPMTVVAMAPTVARAAQQAFPPAVTPTPVLIDPNALARQPSNNEQPLVSSNTNLTQPANDQAVQSLQLPESVTLPTPEFNLQVEVPTRRPTPIFDLPTSTPEAAIPTETETPTRVWGTPVVFFEPLQYTLREGECTLLRWRVENVQAVYYENQGVNGAGEKEVCMDDEPEMRILAVVLPDGNTRIYTATVDYLQPTPTLTPTPSFTPIIEANPTPTWTPSAPTPTPTMPTFYSIALEVFGESRHTCTAGSTCEFALLATNMGNNTDNLVISIVQSGPWPALLCDEGGNCGGSALGLSNVPPTTSRLVRLKVNIAGDATTQTVTYVLQLISQGSGGTVTSSVRTVEVEVP